MTQFDPNAPLGTPANPRFCSVAPPPFHRGHSPIHGRKLTSWSEYRKANKELGLIDVGARPAYPEKQEQPKTDRKWQLVDNDATRRKMLTGNT